MTSARSTVRRETAFARKKSPTAISVPIEIIINARPQHVSDRGYRASRNPVCLIPFLCRSRQTGMTPPAAGCVFITRRDTIQFFRSMTASRLARMYFCHESSLKNNVGKLALSVRSTSQRVANSIVNSIRERTPRIAIIGRHFDHRQCPTRIVIYRSERYSSSRNFPVD